MTPTGRDVVHGLPILNNIIDYLNKIPKELLTQAIVNYLCSLTEWERRSLLTLAEEMGPCEKEKFLKLIRWYLRPCAGEKEACEKEKEKFLKLINRNLSGQQAPCPKPATDVNQAADKEKERDLIKGFLDDAPAAARGAQQKAGSFAVQVPTPSLSFSPGLVNKTGFPTSQLLDVYGLSECFEIAYAANQAPRPVIDRQKYAHLPDVQAFLQQEILGTLRFLREPVCLPLWQQFCNRELVTAVRTRDLDRLQTLRQEFRDQVMHITNSAPETLKKRPYNDPQQNRVTAALAWCFLVDSALLTDRLLQDMREVSAAKGKALAGCEHWCPYYLPDPPAECRHQFNEYVKLRWPIHVFALDPYIQEQNIADSLSTRREMQLALSIAFTNGQISARNMTKYVRRLEAEYETIALNRTQVGFSHGENVFGWRFYPRFQSPDTKSNLEVLFREQLIGGPNRKQLLRDRRLEPGERECVAVVMMPSFVPYVTVDTASNWFPLPNPKHKVLDSSHAVKLSRTVQAIKTGACGVKDAACYRDGEFTRLVRRAEQLEARLPLQTLTSPVPVLNTYGGFEMFSNGTTDLAPELYGWYGAPGIDPDAATTTLFLVGDHFSPLRTRVIVGNQAVDNTDPKFQSLLSRQVMQITFAKGAYSVTDTKGAAATVRVHVATPYGVTRELDIPVVKQSPKADPTPGFSFGDAKLTVNYGMAGTVGQDGKPTGCFIPIPQGAGGELTINWVAPGNTLTPQVEITFEFTYQTATLNVPCGGSVVGDVKAKSVVISKDEASRLANDLVRQITATSPVLPLDPNPLGKGLTSTKVTIKPKVADKMVAQGVETTDQLKVEFKATGVCPGTDLKPTACPDNKANNPLSNVYAVSPPQLSLPYCRDGANDGKFYLGLEKGDYPKGTELTITGTFPAGVIIPKTIDATVKFTYGDCPLEIELPATITGTVKDEKPPRVLTFSVTPEQVKSLVNGAFERLNKFGPFSDATDPLATADPVKRRAAPFLKITAVKIVKINGEKTDPLEIPWTPALKFECVICSPDAMVPRPKMAAPMPSK